MFLAALARPRYDPHRKQRWDGKVGIWSFTEKCNIRGVLRYHFEDRLLERAENSEEIVQGVPELVDLAAFLIHLFAEGFVQCSDTQ
ncbi:hypothetical protein PF011_g27589 [Phytophthora fragariae]|uniref:Uncharacterized protein n=1 Tax=Phytophthora fragariae TaxID=53985 RepID=A0A6A3HF06_9STRA|nr:hypothetical protein PF011_g27589 [Phytophthora fragariae]